MIGQLDSAVYLAGEVKGTLLSSLYLGYPNSVYHYGMANTISFPLDNAQALLSSQSDAQVDIIGYRNNIIDTAFNIYSGEFCSYSKDWYLITGNNSGNNGIRLQSKVQNKTETAIMGESTNKVLSNIIDLLNVICNLLIDIKLEYNVHTHAVVDEVATITTQLISLPLPNKTVVLNNQTQINQGANLAGANYSSITSED